MSSEQNKALVRQLLEDVFNRGDVSMIDNYLAPGFVEHEELPPGIPGGCEGVKALVGMMHGAFPDFHVAIDDIIAEGNRKAGVLARETMRDVREAMGLSYR